MGTQDTSEYSTTTQEALDALSRPFWLAVIEEVAALLDAEAAARAPVKRVPILRNREPVARIPLIRQPSRDGEVQQV